MSILSMVALALLVLIYGGSGLVELPQWRKFADQFARWGFPRWWAAFNPALKIVAALLALLPATRPYGVILCVLVALGAAIVVVRFRERVLYKAALPVAVLTLSAGAWLLAQ